MNHSGTNSYPIIKREFNNFILKNTDVDISKLNIVNNGSAYCSIGYFDFKDRYVEDFLLYDFKNTLHPFVAGFVTSIY